MLTYMSRSCLNINKNIFQRSRLLNNACNFSTCGCFIRKLNNLPLTSKKLVEFSTKTSYNCVRPNSSEHGPPPEKMPPLMDFPRLLWPSAIKTIRNFISVYFIIKPYFDKGFDTQDFILGSKKALEVVSNKIAEGDFRSLEGLVSTHAITTLQTSTSLMSLPQRHEISVNIEDIYFSFVYQIGIIFNEDNEEKRFVEITTVHHVLRGWAAMKARGEEPPINMGMLPEYQHRISVCNYKFIREFTKGIESDWTINLVNHFKPIDHQ